MGYSEVPADQKAFYTVDVSIDGGIEKTKSKESFTYYKQPKVTSVSPALGPIDGGSTMTIHGTGFDQSQAYKRTVKLGYIEVEPISYTKDTMVIKTPAVAIPTTSIVSVSLNSQDYTA